MLHDQKGRFPGLQDKGGERGKGEVVLSKISTIGRRKETI